MVEKHVKKAAKEQERATKIIEKADDLSGMKAICGYFNRSEPTIINLVHTAEFPAKKIGGTWESKKSLIDVWRNKYLQKTGS